MKTKEVFTPLEKYGGKRLRFDMKDVNVLMGTIDVRRAGAKAVVMIKGKIYVVVGCPCDLPDCMCDSYLLETK
jgi:hypothetical protein